jgi:hypothetical protein
MLYVDYTWDLDQNYIMPDRDLNISELGWKVGDYFRIEELNGRMILLKMDPLVKFVKDG